MQLALILLAIFVSLNEALNPSSMVLNPSISPKRASKQIYVSGGEGPNGKQKIVEVYDIGSGVWSRVADLPKERYYFGSASLGGLVYTVGGHNSVFYAGVDVFVPVLNKWNEALRMPTARDRLGVVATDEKIFAVGGNLNGGLNSLEAFDSQQKVTFEILASRDQATAIKV